MSLLRRILGLTPPKTVFTGVPPSPPPAPGTPPPSPGVQVPWSPKAASPDPDMTLIDPVAKDRWEAEQADARGNPLRKPPENHDFRRQA